MQSWLLWRMPRKGTEITERANPAELLGRVGAELRSHRDCPENGVHARGPCLMWRVCMAVAGLFVASLPPKICEGGGDHGQNACRGGRGTSLRFRSVHALLCCSFGIFCQCALGKRDNLTPFGELRVFSGVAQTGFSRVSHAVFTGSS